MVAPMHSSERPDVAAGAPVPRSDLPGRWIEGLSADMPLLEALELIFGERYRAVRHYLPLAAEKADENVEYVHKLRVSCRRLATVLDVLAEGLPDAPRQRLLELLENTRRVCGKARDLDVRREFLESMLKLAPVEDAAVFELLCEQIVCRRERSQRKVRRRLEKLEARLRDAGDDLLSSLHAVDPDVSDSYAPFGKTGCRILSKELAGLWEVAARDLESPQTLHQLRIAGKHLRYAFEVFVPALDESFREDFYPQLEEIQNLLGEIHDAAEATRAFRRTRRKWKKRRGTKKWGREGLSGFRWRELRAGLDAVLLAYAQQAEHARTEFFDLWPGFSGDSFRRPVTDLLAGSAEPADARAVPEPDQGETQVDHEHFLPH
jgi:CHAD domain-containing protein